MPSQLKDLLNEENPGKFLLKLGAADISDVDENLLKENIDVIKLDYDRSKTMFIYAGAEIVGSLTIALAIGFHHWTAWLFVASASLGFFSLLMNNRKMNKAYNTLRKKLQERKK